MAPYLEEVLASISNSVSPSVRCFRDLSGPFWSNILQRGALLPIHTFGYWTVHVMSGVSFLAGGVLDFNLSHCRSVADLCLLYNIRNNPFCSALPVPFVPVQITRGELVADWYSDAPPRCRTFATHAHICNTCTLARLGLKQAVAKWTADNKPLYNNAWQANSNNHSINRICNMVKHLQNETK